MSHYRGRFAPSPTGLLHRGSLIGALASYLDAKANHGKWLVRIEDLDPPRELAGADKAILHSLQTHGLQWDEAIIYQSDRHAVYQQVLDQLIASKKAFYCTCSRSDLLQHGGVYPGNCRHCHSKPAEAHAIRLLVNNETVSFIDAIQGRHQQQLQTELGDFVLKRKDQLFAYQLAVVIDDAKQNITHVVRGSDLLDSTPRQIYLQRQLQYDTPSYAHTPVITNTAGQKLSKQTFAQALDNKCPVDNLLQALAFLQQPTPPFSSRHSPQSILSWATTHWSLNCIPTLMAIPEPLS